KDGLRLDVSVGIEVHRRGELYEVVLSITATALQESEILFIVELSYAGLFEMAGIDAAACERFIFCEAPRIMFPFVDRIIADVTRDGGYPPLNLTPPDWTALYRKERAAA
ncbi:MAG: protein-export chaperone SecB, partial [Defluviicoccus sp.]|nr:protein-export chaperone SecB [Defluviicoccus sp.]